MDARGESRRLVDAPPERDVPPPAGGLACGPNDGHMGGPSASVDTINREDLLPAVCHPGGVPMKLLSRGATDWTPAAMPAPVLSVALDACVVPSPASPAGARLSVSSVIAVDGLLDEPLRAQLLAALVGEEAAARLEHGEPMAVPPTELWERATADGAGAAATWGLRPESLARLTQWQVPALRELGARLAALFPEADVALLPSDAIQSVAPNKPSQRVDCACVLANAAVPGDEFSYHVDADPTSFPDGTAWTAAYGDYFNGEPGAPLLASLVLYLNPEWHRDWLGETLLLDGATGTGVVVAPRPGRALLFHQDITHRLCSPARAAPVPRFSLVLKLVLQPRRPQGVVDLARPAAWGRPIAFGSAAALEAIKRRLLAERAHKSPDT